VGRRFDWNQAAATSGGYNHFAIRLFLARTYSNAADKLATIGVPIVQNRNSDFQKTEFR
jgi:hypothetical protein